MNKLWYVETVLLFLSGYSFCLGMQLNLTESCKSPLRRCILTNLSMSYDDVLVVVEPIQTQLMELVIRNSVIVHMPRDLLQKTPNLTTFTMYNVGLSRLRDLDFKNCPKLIKLILNGNRLSDINENVFLSGNSLEELHLGRNTIYSIHRMAFAGLIRLRYLDLQLNSIQELNENLFAPLTRLEYIDLSGNEIEKIDSYTFATNKELKTVFLNNNKFKVFEPISLEHLSKLILLDLSNSVVEEINLQSVDTLLIQSSGLKSCNISGSVIKFHGSNNQLNSLKVTEKLHVRDLELHGNLFESLDDFIGMLNLQHLDLSENRITSLNTKASLLLPFPALKYLNVASNSIQNLSVENFLLLNRLTHLDLAFNYFSTLDANNYRPLRMLEKFYIDGNHLRCFDYKNFFATHLLLKEVGVSANPWNTHDLREMVSYMNVHSLQIANRFPIDGVHERNSTTSNADHRFPLYKMPNPSTEQSYRDPQDSVSITTSCTVNCKLAVITLVLVLLILLLLVVRLLNGEQRTPLCCRGSTFHLLQHQHVEPLNEEMSEV